MPPFGGIFIWGFYGTSFYSLLDSIGDCMVSSSSISKKAIIFFLAFALNFFSFSNARASTIAGSGWDITSSVVNGATTTFNASKTKLINGASVVVKGVAKITPTGPQVGKMILRTGLSLAVTVALDELVNGVDYVLDPANNSIIYKTKSPSSCVSDGSDCPSFQYLYYSNRNYYPTPDSACSALMSEFAGSSYTLNGTSCVVLDSNKNFVVSNTSSRVLNPSYDPTKDNDTRSIGVDVVGGRIVSDSATQDEARFYTNTVANTITAPNEQDQIVPATTAIGQFDQTQSYPSETAAQSKTETKTNADGSTTSDTKIDIPAACSWMPSVCEAMQVVINSPNTLSTWWTGVVTSVQDFIGDDTGEDTNLDIDTNLDKPNSTIAFGGSCPSSQSVNVSFAGINQTINFDYTYFCQLADFIRPVIIVLSSFAAALIVAGVRDSET